MSQNTLSITISTLGMAISLVGVLLVTHHIADLPALMLIGILGCIEIAALVLFFRRSHS